jgi:hypothetical protein
VAIVDFTVGSGTDHARAPRSSRALSVRAKPPDTARTTPALDVRGLAEFDGWIGRCYVFSSDPFGDDFFSPFRSVLPHRKRLPRANRAQQGELANPLVTRRGVLDAVASGQVRTRKRIEERLECIVVSYQRRSGWFARLAQALIVLLAASSLIAQPGGAEAADPVVIGRSERSTTFLNPDGTYSTKLYTVPRNFRDPDGNWHEADPTLVPADDGGFRTKAGSTSVHFGRGIPTTSWSMFAMPIGQFGLLSKI